ncbi:hypothetical protein CRE_23740 [Caenorhabditis remanei]|uniref:Uncharacterized protein n=1 Tax=Caenorhabditis remanei TaxID=31234 RepID=E3NFU8_CAERE|nr:hypothetical protein CRE_23740 [Caenorhabditis remanei]
MQLINMLAAAVPNWRHGDLERLNEVLQAPGGDVRLIPSGIIQICKESSLLSFGPPNAKRTVATHFWKRYGLITNSAVDRMVYVKSQPAKPPQHHYQHINTFERERSTVLVDCHLSYWIYEKVRQEKHERIQPEIPRRFLPKKFSKKTFILEATIMMQPFGSKLALPGNAEW